MPLAHPATLIVTFIANTEAQLSQHAEVEAAHFWIAICKLADMSPSGLPRLGSPEAAAVVKEALEELRAWFAGKGLPPTALRRSVRIRLGRGAYSGQGRRSRSAAARAICEGASELAREEGAPSFRPIHLARALLDTPPPELQAELQQLDPQVTAFVPPPPPIDKPLTGVLGRCGRDLTAAARAGQLDRLIGRKDELRRVAQVLSRRKKANAVLVGEPGVGKTGIVEGLALKTVSPTCPRAFQGKQIVEVSAAALMAGTARRGELEERLQQLVHQAEADPDLILFFDELHTLMATGEGAGNAANVLKPALARGALRVIGATTTKEYEKHIRQDDAFARRFEVVWVEEPSRAETLEILAGVQPMLEEHHGLVLAQEALEAAVELSQRYLLDKRLPDKAIDLLDQACAQEALKSLTLDASEVEAPPPQVPVGREAVARVVAARANVPLEFLLLDEASRLGELRRYLEQRVVGQPRAVEAVSRAVRSAHAGLKDPRRPVATFLFVGPSGVGKTELAKALTEFLFQDVDRLLRLDMAEYMEKHQVARLIGSPPGYVGHGDEGQLTGPIQRCPCTVVLFDEIEKAHEDVLNVLLGVLDEGRLTDGQGRRADFREAVIVLTSNLGNREAEGADGAGSGTAFGFVGAERRQTPQSEELGRALAARREAHRRAVQARLRPELLNRLTEVVVFDPLDQESLEEVVSQAVLRLGARLAERDVRLVLEPAARRVLAAKGHDPRYGAREVTRVVEREVGQPLAEALLAGAIPNGGVVRIVRQGETADVELVY